MTKTKMTDKEAYLALVAKGTKDHTALNDLIKCIDKMVMLGGKMKALDGEIQAAIWSKKYDHEILEFEAWCRDELEALTYMADRLKERVEGHKLINHCRDQGDHSICDFIKDFETVTLMVKSREMTVKETLLKFIKLRHIGRRVTMVG